MSYDERQVSDLIGTVRTTYVMILENLAQGNVASALRCMEKLKMQAEALYDIHINSLKRHLEVAEPGAPCREESQAKPPDAWAAGDEPGGHGQDGR